MRIIVDAMGGDNAPQAPVEGALRAVRELGVEVLLTGRPAEIGACLAKLGHTAPPPGVEIAPASQVIEMEDNPARAFKDKPDASMTVGLRLLKEGRGEAFVSAGSTGALLSAATLLIKRIRGIRRAALAPVVPNARGNMVLIDCGATAEGTPEYLLQFAFMGAYYARRFLGIENPRVGLLNIGTEPSKGMELQKAAHALLTQAHEAGRIRNLGWSFHGDQKVFDHLLAMHDSGEARWDFVQIQMNYVDWKHASDRNVNAEYLYGELEKRGIPAVIMEPLLGGRLSRLNDHLVERLKERRPTESTASWAFRYAGSWPGVLTVLSGMTYMEHLQDNIRTYSPLEPCTGEELALLEDTAQLMLKYPTVPCTECQYCMPCPYGLDIPAIFAHYNRCVNEGNVPKDRQDPGYREARRAFLIGYDRSVPKLRQASHCIGCNQCVSHCPQSIKIPQQLRRIDRFVEQLKQGTL